MTNKFIVFINISITVIEYFLKQGSRTALRFQIGPNPKQWNSDLQMLDETSNRTRFINWFCKNNELTCVTRNAITRNGHENHVDTGIDHVLVKNDLAFVEHINDLVTMTRTGFDHRFCYIDINLIAIQNLLTMAIAPLWTTRPSNNPSIKNKYDKTATNK